MQATAQAARIILVLFLFVHVHLPPPVDMRYMTGQPCPYPLSISWVASMFDRCAEWPIKL